MPNPQFLQQMSALIAAHGLSDIIVIIRDPDGKVGYYGPTGALERLREEIAKKVGAPLPTDTEWG